MNINYKCTNNMLSGERFIGDVHSCQLQKFPQILRVRTATDLCAAMFVLAAIICGIHYRMTLKASAEIYFGKILSKKYYLRFFHGIVICILLFPL